MTHVLLFVRALLVNNNCRIALLTIGLFSLLSSNADLLAAPTTSTTANGTWNDGTKWSAGAPSSGDSVGIGNSMTVSVSDSFGDNTSPFEPSVWAGGTLTISSGVTLTNVAGSIFVKDSGADLTMAGGGTLLNQGTINLQNNLWRMNTNTIIQNENAFNLTENGARLYLQSNGSRFHNMTGGSINVTLPVATEVATIDGAANVDGNLVNFAATPMVTFTQGILNFSPPNGGTLNDALFTNLFDVTSLNANPTSLRLGGGWDEINLTAATDLTKVTLGHGFNTLVGGSTFNVAANATNPDGLVWGSGSITISSGRTLTNIETFTKQTGSDLTVTGGGTFLNQGTFNLQSSLMRLNADVVVENEGQFTFSENGSRFYLQQNGTRLLNTPGGTIEVNLPLATNSATIDGVADVDGNVVITGDPIKFTQGILNFAPNNGGTLDDSLFANLFSGATPPNANSPLRLGGGWDSIDLTAATDLTHVTLGYTFNTLVGGTTLNVSEAAGGLRWNGGSISIASGRTLTNTGKFIKIADLTATGGGTLLNQGNFELQNTWLRLNTNTVVDNEATLILGDGGGQILFNQAGTQVINRPDAIIQASGTGNHFFQAQGAFGTFDNQGTLEITSGEVDLHDLLTVNQISGGNTLTGGTWKLLADNNTVKLDFRSGGTSTGDGDQTNFDGSITNIGAGASLVLSAINTGTVEFPQLGSVSTVDGSLYVHSDIDLAVGASPLAVSGTLGGDGTYTAVDSIVFTGGELDPSALDGGSGTLTIVGDLILDDTTQLNFLLDTPNLVGGVNDLVQVNGNLTLDGVLDLTQLPGFGDGTYRLFNYTGSLTNNGLETSNPFYQIDLSTLGEVNLIVVPIPEPSTGLLLLAGIVFFRRKRKKNVC